MKITNTEVQYLYSWLNAPLHGEQARARNKFAKIIKDQYEKSLSGRTDILKKYADKDKKTKEAIIKDGLYQMPDTTLEKAKADMNKFLDKETIYEVTKSEKPLIRIIVKILNDAKIPLDIANGEIYDQIMTELEKVSK